MDLYKRKSPHITLNTVDSSNINHPYTRLSPMKQLEEIVSFQDLFNFSLPTMYKQSYYSYLLYLVVIVPAVVVTLNLLFTRNGELFNVGLFLTKTNPYLWALLGSSLAVGLSVVGAAWYPNLIGGSILPDLQ